jgi:hypothetical protein
VTAPTFLPGVPGAAVLQAFAGSPGNEVATGKFTSPESSAALAANAFGWFLDRPSDLPPLPGVPMGPTLSVAVEAEMRFPWRGGRHPWLDAALTTATTLVGIESKRYEPFRPGKTAQFPAAFAARDWGRGMARFDALRRAMAEGGPWRRLDAAQLVKHAYGLRTQGEKRALGAVLVYLYAEPPAWASGRPVDPALIALHRHEVAAFAQAVQGQDVTFAALRWSDLLAQWRTEPRLAAHAEALEGRFGPLGASPHSP